MLLIAKHYLKLGGQLYTPGEIITQAVDDDVKARLMMRGALVERDDTPEEPENAAPVEAQAAQEPAAATAEDTAAPDDGTGEATEAEPPVIDAMEGVIKPKKERKRDESKTAEKRRDKGC